jgi:hypothetical protein
MAYGGLLATTRPPSYLAMSLKWSLCKYDFPVNISDARKDVNTPEGKLCDMAKYVADGQV